MASRDRFTIEIDCPACGRVGVAEVSEDDYPFMKSPRFSVDKLPPGFRVIHAAERRTETILVCDCGKQFSA